MQYGPQDLWLMTFARAEAKDVPRLRELCTSLAGSQAHVPKPQLANLDLSQLLGSVLQEMQQHRELEGLVLELRPLANMSALAGEQHT